MAFASNLETARARIADCLQLDEQGALVQRRDYLNLAGLGLTDAELTEPFAPHERGLPEICFADLTALRYLDLTGNQLTALPECVTHFTGLVWLGLNFNQVAKIDGIGSLVHLRRLYLRGNQLSELPQAETMGNLQGLLELDLTGNSIATLPTSMGHLIALEHVALEGGDLDPDLRAAWKEKKWASLREHLLKADQELLGVYRQSAEFQNAVSQLAGNGALFAEIVSAANSMYELRVTLSRPEIRAQIYPAAVSEEPEIELDLDEIPAQYLGKVVLVGCQEHGKTCLQRALRDEEFIEGHKSTPGMSRERLHLQLDGTFVSSTQRADTPGPHEGIIDLTLWDMGGQESYQHTHQMFFTPSAVYLVVTRPRKGGSVDKLHEWIDLVRRRTEGEASLIVVSTCCRDEKPDEAVTLMELQARYGEMIRAVVAVDSKDGTGIPQLRRLLAATVQEPRARCRHTWLPGWAKVLDELAGSPEAFLRWPKVREICARHEIAFEDEQRLVIRTGAYIGALLWREDIPAGEDVVILNPDWLSRAVARLLDDEEIKRAHGLVEIASLSRVWAGPGRDDTPGYDSTTYPALIELMEINELAYRPRVPGKKVGEGHLLLITQMVEDMPKQDVEAAWEAIKPKDSVETTRIIAFRKVGGFGYGEIPDLIYLLIFRLREFSLGRHNHQDAVHWQRGMLVTDDYGNSARIELTGQLLKITARHRLLDGLMHSIVNRIGVKDDSHWNCRGLEKVEFVSCGQLCTKGTPEAGLISVDSCVKADRHGNKAIECEICHEFLPIHELLNQKPAEPAEARELIAWLTPWLIGLQTGQADVLKELRAQSQELRERLSELRLFVEMQGDGIIDQFYSESKDGPRLFSLIPIPGNNWNPKSWTQMSFRITVWCEASRRPVPFFGQRKKDGQEFQGSEIITLTRDWVQKGKRLLIWSSWAALSITTGGASAVGGIVNAAGLVISPEDAQALATELSKQQRSIKEVASSIPDESKNPLRQADLENAGDQAEDFSPLGRKGYGTPLQDELALIRHLREEFRKKDPTWGGLEPRTDGKFGRVWAHPEWEKA